MTRFPFASAHMGCMKQQRKIEVLVLALAAVIALTQPHVNGLTVLAVGLVAAVLGVEYRYTCAARAAQTEAEAPRS